MEVVIGSSLLRTAPAPRSLIQVNPLCRAHNFKKIPIRSEDTTQPANRHWKCYHPAPIDSTHRQRRDSVSLCESRQRQMQPEKSTDSKAQPNISATKRATKKEFEGTEQNEILNQMQPSGRQKSPAAAGSRFIFKLLNPTSNQFSLRTAFNHQFRFLHLISSHLTTGPHNEP